MIQPQLSWPDEDECWRPMNSARIGGYRRQRRLGIGGGVSLLIYLYSDGKVTMGWHREASSSDFGGNFARRFYEKGGLSNATTVGGFSHRILSNS